MGLIVFLAWLLIPLGLAWGVYALTHRSLRIVLDGIVRRSAATSFFLRAYLITLVFSALSGGLGYRWDLTGGRPIMEHVWTGANAITSVVYAMLFVLVCYVVLVTILVAALGKKSDEPPACLHCGYSLKGLIDDCKCPECGQRYAGPIP
jgi:hypothetical protein